MNTYVKHSSQVKAAEIAAQKLNPISQKKNTTINAAIIHDKSLSVFQKILLATDGTVTDLVSLYTGKSIKVSKIAQHISLSGALEDFLCPRETPLLKRNILLCNKIKNYIYAESIFVFGLLSRSIQYKLLETDQPIGLMWKEEKLETYRDLLRYKIEICEEVASYFDIQPQTPIVSRTYYIYHQQAILGVITEKFPITYFRKNI